MSCLLHCQQLPAATPPLQPGVQSILEQTAVDRDSWVSFLQDAPYTFDNGLLVSFLEAYKQKFGVAGLLELVLTSLNHNRDHRKNEEIINSAFLFTPLSAIVIAFLKGYYCSPKINSEMARLFVFKLLSANLTPGELAQLALKYPLKKNSSSRFLTDWQKCLDTEIITALEPPTLIALLENLSNLKMGKWPAIFLMSRLLAAQKQIPAADFERLAAKIGFSSKRSFYAYSQDPQALPLLARDLLTNRPQELKDYLPFFLKGQQLPLISAQLSPQVWGDYLSSHFNEAEKVAVLAYLATRPDLQASIEDYLFQENGLYSKQALSADGQAVVAFLQQSPDPAATLNKIETYLTPKRRKATTHEYALQIAAVTLAQKIGQPTLATAKSNAVRQALGLAQPFPHSYPLMTRNLNQNGFLEIIALEPLLSEQIKADLKQRNSYLPPQTASNLAYLAFLTKDEELYQLCEANDFEPLHFQKTFPRIKDSEPFLNLLASEMRGELTTALQRGSFPSNSSLCQVFFDYLNLNKKEENLPLKKIVGQLKPLLVQLPYAQNETNSWLYLSALVELKQPLERQSLVSHLRTTKINNWRGLTFPQLNSKVLEALYRYQKAGKSPQ